MSFPIKHLAHCIYFITDTAIRVYLLIKDRAQLSNWKLISGYGQIYFSNCILAVPGVTLPLAWILPPPAHNRSSYLTALLRVSCWACLLCTGIRQGYSAVIHQLRQPVFNYSDNWKSTWKPIPVSLHSQQFAQNRLSATRDLSWMKETEALPQVSELTSNQNKWQNILLFPPETHWAARQIPTASAASTSSHPKSYKHRIWSYSQYLPEQPWCEKCHCLWLLCAFSSTVPLGTSTATETDLLSLEPDNVCRLVLGASDIP